MNSIQIYSNTSLLYQYIPYVSLFTIITILGIEIYLYIVQYVQRTNDEIDKMSKIISTHSKTIEKYNKELLRLQEESIQSQVYIQKHSQWISGISKEINGYENKFEKIEEKVNKLLEDNKINIDVMSNIENYVLTFEKNIIKSIDDIYEIQRSNVTDIYEIERNIESIQENEQMIPNYVLIGHRYMDNYNISLPIFVPNDVKIDAEFFEMYKLLDCTLFVNHFKYLKNMEYINLNELDNFHTVRFVNSLYYRVHDEKNAILIIKNKNLARTCININNQHGRDFYIPSISDDVHIKYFKKGLLLLRSELLRMNIKLVMNNEFENFIQ